VLQTIGKQGGKNSKSQGGRIDQARCHVDRELGIKRKTANRCLPGRGVRVKLPGLTWRQHPGMGKGTSQVSANEGKGHLFTGPLPLSRCAINLTGGRKKSGLGGRGKSEKNYYRKRVCATENINISKRDWVEKRASSGNHTKKHPTKKKKKKTGTKSLERYTSERGKELFKRRENNITPVTDVG